MERLKNTFLTTDAYQNGATAPVMDLRQGGQMGFSSDFVSAVSWTPFVRQNIIPVLMKHPIGFDDLPAEKEFLIGALKALIEERALTIDGLADTINVEFGSTPFAGGGEIFEVPNGATREPNQPSYTWQEVEGRAVTNFWYRYISMFVYDPELRAPAIITTNEGADRTDRLPDYYSFTTLFIEPNLNMNRVVLALLCYNMVPRTSGPREMGFDKTAANQTQTVTLPFSALTQRGAGVNQLAQRVLDQMRAVGANPQTRMAAIQGIDADVTAINNVGNAARIAENIRQQVSPT